MSSILTPHIPKVYYNANDLNHLFNFPDTFDILSTKVVNGKIHSIYARIENSDYTKLYNFYIDKSGEEKNKFYYYDNNKIGVLIYNDVCEKWKYDNSTVYSYDDVDVCYTVDSFSDRTLLKPSDVNDLDIRFIAYGNWFIYNDKLQVLLGNQIMYQTCTILDNLSTVAYNQRVADNLANSALESASLQALDDHLNVCNRKFILYRSFNNMDAIYNKTAINKLFCSQKLKHIIEQPLKLLEPIKIC
ncbi:hypothetical protein MrNuV_ORF107 [Macrobrachium rosenbergii nudivirus]|nr:hypothetical protein MrNuV_ORF107 [Macrobrachium rosenbergii nudivirus]